MSKTFSHFIFIVLLISTVADAEQGDGSLRLEYQYVRTGAFDSSIGDIDIGNTDAQVYMLSGEYAVTDRLTLMGSLPWIRKRHTGALPHNPVTDFSNYQPPTLEILDDGNYNSGWQDLYIGARYQWLDGPLSVAPFMSYGTPTNDYSFYGHSALGRNLWHLPVGAALAYTPLFSDWVFSGDVAYVFTEKSLGVDVSHWLINASVGYFVTPRFVPKVFVATKYAPDGLSFPDDFDITDLDTEAWYFHDRTIRHNFTNVGVGFDWLVNDRYQLAASWFTMIEPDQVNNVDRAWSVSLTYFFGKR